MSIHKTLSGNIPTEKLNADDPWRNPFPNTPDFTFNYRHLLEQAVIHGGGKIATPKNPKREILIVGAGVAGLTAARLLAEAGYTNITIVEKTSRIGGRNYSLTYKNKAPSETQNYTTYEMGAMRFPFLKNADGSKPQSVMAYYAEKFGIATGDFPDPGQVKTGIWLNEGQGVENSTPKPPGFNPPDFYTWLPADKEPPQEDLKMAYNKWVDFVDVTVGDKPGFFRNQYNDADNWKTYWTGITKVYDEMTFGALSTASADNRTEKNPGGLGMSPAISRLFYTIGAGDGSWGAFFNISSLYPIRTLLFGFGANHQLIYGNFTYDPKQQYEFNPPQEPSAPKNPYNNHNLTDSSGVKLDAPFFVGVQSFAENIFYRAYTPRNSLYERISADSSESSIRLYVDAKVSIKSRSAEYQVLIQPRDGQQITKNFDDIIITPTTWASETSDIMSPYLSKNFPARVWNSMKISHWITSCKVFFTLKKRYWEDGENNPFPQVLVSDSFLQDSYGYVAKGVKGGDKNFGVFLATYTWEDDALKLIADKGDDAKNLILVERVKSELRSIFGRANTTKDAVDFFDQYIETDEGDLSTNPIIHWSTEPAYRGCAKLYRANTEFYNWELLAYNENHSMASNVYLAGEACSVYGGWTEPAFRHAVDAVLHLMHNNGDTFVKIPEEEDWFGDHYPKYGSANPYE